MHGGNGRDVYVDTEAVRSGHAVGLQMLLTQAWHRYHLPMAVTECHLTCTREQQLRWLDQQWNSVMALNDCSIPVVALTVWALVGAYDWSSLFTRMDGHYEPGAFKLVEDKCKPTALTCMMKAIAARKQFTHPALNGNGWWEAEKPFKYSRPLIVVIDATEIAMCCRLRYLEVVSTDASSNFQEIANTQTWAMIAKEENQQVGLICASLDIPYLIILDLKMADNIIDNLIDEVALKAVYESVATTGLEVKQ